MKIFYKRLLFSLFFLSLLSCHSYQDYQDYQKLVVTVSNALGVEAAQYKVFFSNTQETNEYCQKQKKIEPRLRDLRLSHVSEFLVSWTKALKDLNNAISLIYSEMVKDGNLTKDDPEFQDIQQKYLDYLKQELNQIFSRKLITTLWIINKESELGIDADTGRYDNQGMLYERFLNFEISSINVSLELLRHSYFLIFNQLSPDLQIDITYDFITCLTWDGGWPPVRETGGSAGFYNGKQM